MAMPTTPVMSPPVRKEMRLGRKFEKSFDGETTFAATFVFSVATSSATSAMSAISGRLKRYSKTTGSQIAVPKIPAEAEVTATPMKE